MSTLRDFLGLEIQSVIKQISVYYNDQGGTHNHSGCCCLYVTESGISGATIELWGGGGGGAGACCCMHPRCQGSPGGYIMKKISLSEGTCLTICAAGSTACTSSCQGCFGSPSFVLCNGSNIGCAPGGFGGTTRCFMWNFDTGYACGVGGCNRGHTGDVCSCQYPGYTNPSSWCADSDNMWTQGTPKYSSNSRFSGQRCVVEWTKQGCCYNRNHWPAGPGHNGASCGGGYCWGSWGAGGLAILTLYG